MLLLHDVFFFLVDQTCLTLTPVEPSDIFFSTTTEDPPSSESTSSTPSLSSSNGSMMTGRITSVFLGTECLLVSQLPSAKDRREMARIVVDEMRLNELNPSKSQCLTVAKMIVKQHPKNFADVMRDGTLIGSDYGSLLTQLKT